MKTKTKTKTKIKKGIEVITYVARCDETITLSRAQVNALEANQLWPRSSGGWKFLEVKKFWHIGQPTYRSVAKVLQISKAK